MENILNIAFFFVVQSLFQCARRLTDVGYKCQMRCFRKSANQTREHFSAHPSSSLLIIFSLLLANSTEADVSGKLMFNRPSGFPVRIENPDNGILLPATLKLQAGRVIAERINGRDLFIQNPEDLSEKPAVPILRLAKDGTLVIDGSKALSVDKWEQIKNERALNPKINLDIRPLDDTLRKINEITQPLLRPHGIVPAETADMLDKLYADAEAHTTAAYAVASENGDDQTQARLAGLYRDIAIEKAYYGVDDNYAPSSYLRIYKSTFACCKVIINPQNANPRHTSGSLIGINLVLTCGHHVRDGAQFRVRFPLKNGGEVSYTAQRIFAGVPRNDNEGPLDFAILKLQPSPEDMDIAEREPFTLLSGVANLEVPVYAVGYSLSGPQLVHDGSNIVFPHELSIIEKHHMHMRIRISFQTINILSGSDTSTTPSTDAMFKHLYRQQGQVYHYISRAHPVQHPVFGLDTDTFTGDSGAPVISRKDFRICGILITGQPDPATLPVATALAHEKALPISAIHAQLTEKLVGWPEDFGVLIE